jgi:hypothetical protein
LADTGYPSDLSYGHALLPQLGEYRPLFVFCQGLETGGIFRSAYFFEQFLGIVIREYSSTLRVQIQRLPLG